MQIGFKVESCTAKGCPYRTEPHTNADRIRSMTDEELADALFYGQFTTKQATLDWLRQEVKCENS